MKQNTITGNNRNQAYDVPRIKKQIVNVSKPIGFIKLLDFGLENV